MKKRILLLTLVAALGVGTSAFCHEPEINEKTDLAFSGYMSVLFNYNHLADDEADTASDTTDLFVDEFGIGIAAGLAENVSANALILYEETDDDSLVSIDEAYLTYKKDMLYAYAGKRYLPFADSDTSFVSDPFTHDLGEIRETALCLGADIDILTVEAGAFNGDSDKLDSDKTENDDKIDDFYVAVDADLVKTDAMEINLALAYLSDITDTDDLESEDGYDTRAGGISVALSATADTGSLLVEYVSADGDLYMEDSGVKPATLNIELTTTMIEDLMVGLKYETSEDFATVAESGEEEEDADSETAEGDSGMTDLVRYGAVAGYEISEKAEIKLEFLRTEDDADTINDSVTAQLELEF